MQRSQITQSRLKAGEILERPPIKCIALLLQGRRRAWRLPGGRLSSDG